MRDTQAIWIGQGKGVICICTWENVQMYEGHYMSHTMNNSEEFNDNTFMFLSLHLSGR